MPFATAVEQDKFETKRILVAAIGFVSGIVNGPRLLTEPQPFPKIIEALFFSDSKLNRLMFNSCRRVSSILA